MAQNLQFRQRLQHAEVESGAADAAAGECQTDQLHGGGRRQWLRRIEGDVAAGNLSVAAPYQDARQFRRKDGREILPLF